MTKNWRLPAALALTFLSALGLSAGAHAIDAQQTTKEAASSTGNQGGAQQPGVSQLGTDCPSSTTAGVAGGSAQAARQAGQEEAAAGPCPPAGGGPGAGKAQPEQ